MFVHSCVLILLAASLNAENLSTPVAEKPLRWTRVPSDQSHSSYPVSNIPENSASDRNPHKQTIRLKEADEVAEIKGENEKRFIFPAERTRQQSQSNQILRTKFSHQMPNTVNENLRTGSANQIAISPRIYPQPAAALHYSTQARVNPAKPKSRRPFVERNDGVDVNKGDQPLEQTAGAPVMSLRKSRKRNKDCKMCRRNFRASNRANRCK